jgi:Ca-activated chloride channel family protein
MKHLDPQLRISYSRSRTRWSRIAVFLALVLFIVSLTGPKWGSSDDRGVLQGRDLVVLIDLSKSMLAEDVAGEGVHARWQAVQKGLDDLLDTVQQRGGHRIAFVVFATETWVLSPLTNDYDFLRHKIDELDPNYPPPETLPKEENSLKSGTQIGEAIREGVAVHDPKFSGYQDILLLTDGDDPDNLKGVDVGVSVARNASIPVHVIGVGDPARTTEIPTPQLPVEVTLKEKELKQLASEAKGEYASWHREVPRVGEFFRTAIEPHPSRDLGDLALPRKQERYRWFLLPGLLLLTLGWWLRSR